MADDADEKPQGSIEQRGIILSDCCKAEIVAQALGHCEHDAYGRGIIVGACCVKCDALFGHATSVYSDGKMAYVTVIPDDVIKGPDDATKAS